MNTDWMSPKEYFEQIVRPTVEDYQADRRDHRRACAVLQLQGITERYYSYHRAKGDKERIYHKKRASEFAQQLGKQCPEVWKLWEAANGVKHPIPDPDRRFSGMAHTATGIVFDAGVNELGGLTIDQVIDAVHEYWRERLDRETDEFA